MPPLRGSACRKITHGDLGRTNGLEGRSTTPPVVWVKTHTTRIQGVSAGFSSGRSSAGFSSPAFFFFSPAPFFSSVLGGVRGGPFPSSLSFTIRLPRLAGISDQGSRQRR